MPMLADGTVMSINDGASSAYVAIPGVLTITPPNAVLKKYDATALDSPAGTDVMAPGTRAAPGELKFTMFYLAAQDARLKGLRGTAKNIKLVYPDTEEKVFAGWVESVEWSTMENQKPTELTVTFPLSVVVD